jgi:hypothetical protein
MNTNLRYYIVPAYTLHVNAYLVEDETVKKKKLREMSREKMYSKSCRIMILGLFYEIDLTFFNMHLIFVCVRVGLDNTILLHFNISTVKSHDVKNKHHP